MTYQEALEAAGPGAKRVGVVCRARLVCGYYVGDKDGEIVAFFRKGKSIGTPACFDKDLSKTSSTPCSDCPAKS